MLYKGERNVEYYRKEQIEETFMTAEEIAEGAGIYVDDDAMGPNVGFIRAYLGNGGGCPLYRKGHFGLEKVFCRWDDIHSVLLDVYEAALNACGGKENAVAVEAAVKAGGREYAIVVMDMGRLLSFMLDIKRHMDETRRRAA